MISGIDVSEWQGHVDFNAVKASGVKFVLIRAGYGRSASQEDRYFAEHYTQAKAAGLQVGAYWYSYAVSPADAANEARACLTVLGNRHFDFPIYFDLEEAFVVFWNRTVAMPDCIFRDHHCRIISRPLSLVAMLSGWLNTDHVVTTAAIMEFGNIHLLVPFQVSMVTVIWIMHTLTTRQLLIKNSQLPGRILMS